MSACLPYRQAKIKVVFAYMALLEICLFGKDAAMEHRNRLTEHRQRLDMTIEQVADATGLSVSYVWRLENGERNLSIKNLNLFAHAFSVQPSDLVVDRQAKRSVGVMGLIGAGAEISPEEEQVPPEGLYEVEIPYDADEDAVAFEVVGDSMWPRYDPGDIIICSSVGDRLESLVGWEAAVRTGDGRRYLKRVLRGSSAGTFDLESHNASPIRGKQIVWAAEILHVVRAGKWRKLTAAGQKREFKRAKG